MRINNKTFKEWTEKDIDSIIENDDFRESQFLDYKRTFEFLDSDDRIERVRGKDEFRNDICSFANADGGDLIFGISERNGLACKKMPINIRNIDHFEMDLRNALLSIMPSVPPVEFCFISISSGGYIVVVHIEKGFFKPYITIENQTTFRFYVRHGNRKEAMSYSEISNNFLNAASLSAEIKKFRMERISEFLGETPCSFGIIHIIPATFRNPTDFIPMCDLSKAGKIPLPCEFNNHVRGMMVPNVDGIWFPSEEGLKDSEVLTLFDNGSVELKITLNTRLYRDSEILTTSEFISAIDDVVEGTAKMYMSLGRHATVYICVSIIGCKGYWNEDYYYNAGALPSKADRDRIICSPIELRDILDIENVQKITQECKKRTRYALGMRN